MSARGSANQSLYLGKLLIQGWRQAASRGEAPVATLAQAYLPAARQHLLHAYGWFLLELANSEGADAAPPATTAELPPPPTGKAETAEIDECRQLEQQGWLAALLAEPQMPQPSGRRRGGGIALAAAGLGPDDLQQWADELQTLFERMRDALDEQ